MEDNSRFIHFEVGKKIPSFDYEIAFYRLTWTVGNDSNRLRRQVISHWAVPIEELAELLYQRKARVGDVHDIMVQGVLAQDFF